MDDLDRQLLLFLQNGIPLQKRPFEGMAAKLGLDSADVLLRISRLKLKKTIRQITAILEGRHLGYEQTLAAMIVPAAKLQTAVFWMKAHPGVIHCTVKEHEFNLWFTLALPAGMMEQQIRRLHSFCGAKKTVFLPLLKRFKGAGSGEWSAEVKRIAFSPLELSILRKIQEDFPLDDAPFRKWAAEAGIPESELLNILEAWSRKGYLKRIIAVTPLKSPAGKMALAVWEVPEERQGEAGSAIAAFDEITECVKRSAYPEFPYALHAFIRAKDRRTAESILKKVSSKVGSWPHRLLWDVEEYKKIRLKYFSEGLNDWQSRVPESQRGVSA